MTHTPQVHLLVRGKRVACRAASYSRFSRNPRMVTCNNCVSSPHMADAEKKAQLNLTNRA